MFPFFSLKGRFQAMSFVNLEMVAIKELTNVLSFFSMALSTIFLHGLSNAVYLNLRLNIGLHFMGEVNFKPSRYSRISEGCFLSIKYFLESLLYLTDLLTQTLILF